MTQRVRVALEPAYDVWVGAGRDVLDAALTSVDAGRASAVAVITDDRVAAAGHAARVADAWRALNVPVHVLEVAAGEASKSVAVWADLVERLATLGLDRDAWVCAVGGGVVGDLAGFVAASYLRGVRFVQVPTTLLAMVDASVGGKTGVNALAGKNLIGAFWQPQVVVADVDALATLPPAVLREGAVELYKHALLEDAPWRAAFHEGEFGLAESLDAATWTQLVSDGVRVKADVVAADPLERGVRAHLNLGHTLAHALEAATDHAIAHGTAVAYGLAYAALLGHARGLADWRADAFALARWAADAPLPDAPFADLRGYMARDKKRRAGRVRWVLLEHVGHPVVVDEVPDDVLDAAWSALHGELATLPHEEASA
ncbi:MAG: 3-dehydroquinate synthase [Trueperaceae bacterium]